MKILTIIYRFFTLRCTYCGSKKEYPVRGFSCCPTDVWQIHQGYTNKGCYITKKFINHKEAKVQKALGLLY